MQFRLQFGLRYETQKEKAVELADRETKLRIRGHGVTQLVKCLPSVQEALGFHPSPKAHKTSMLHTCNPGIWEVEEGD